MSFRASTSQTCVRQKSARISHALLSLPVRPISLARKIRFTGRKVPMQRRTTSWYSPNLNMEMPLVSYGHAGPPLLMFPTAAADYLEYERFYLVDAIKEFLDAGKLRAYSINSVNRYSLLNEQMPPHLKAELLTRYDRYIVDEVL